MTIENKFLEWRTGWSFQILRLHEMKKSKREGHFYNEFMTQRNIPPDSRFFLFGL